MDYTITNCRRGGYNIVVNTDYDDLREAVQDNVEMKTTTPHLSIAQFKGEKLSIKPGKIVVKTDSRQKAEKIAESLLS